MASNGLNMQNVANEIIGDMASQAWTFNMMGANVQLNGGSPICFNCSTMLWNELVYKYREKINPLVPSHVQNRPKCWYGKECTT